jgi:hypothetical protein
MAVPAILCLRVRVYEYISKEIINFLDSAVIQGVH